MSHRLEAMGKAKYAGLTVLHNGRRTFNGKINFDNDALTIPLKRKKPETYFVNSMSDLFHEAVPFGFVDRVFAVMALCPQHTFQVLTKRPDRMAEYFSDPESIRDNWQDRIAPAMNDLQGKLVGLPRPPFPWPLPNVWLGTSVENQKSLYRVMELSKCPAVVHFWSVEPLLEDLGNIRGYLEQNVEWVIVGGESGSKARPFNVAWARSIIKQCKDAGVACFVKQLGAKPIIAETAETTISVVMKDSHGGDMAEWSEDLRVREMPGLEASHA
jgi:protein gp37